VNAFFVSNNFLSELEKNYCGQKKLSFALRKRYAFQIYDVPPLQG